MNFINPLQVLKFLFKLQILRQIPFLKTLFPNKRKKIKQQILAHVMPWYASKPISGVWGWHWTMNHFNPEKFTNGRREIASKFCPLTGPYDSFDRNIVEYQLLTMKLAGIDGIIIDWYGLTDLYDYSVIHRNATLLVDMAEKFGLSFAICYEDRTVIELEKNGRLNTNRKLHVANEIRWLSKNWFSKKNYLHFDDKPLLLSFGVDNMSDEEWKQAIKSADTSVAYVSQAVPRKVATGAFDWPVPSQGLGIHKKFIKKSDNWELAIPVAFPRFDDIYEQAKVHGSYGHIPDDNGKTFRNLLTDAIESDSPFIQIATWNDWGEGTSIEPSLEFGNRDLRTIQDLRRDLIDSDFPHKARSLDLPFKLLELRRKARTSSSKLDSVSKFIAEGDTEKASKRISGLLKETD
jgi:hypothetical protein